MDDKGSKKGGRRFLWRALALLLALVMIVELGIPSVTKVSYEPGQMQGEMPEKAAQLIEAYEAYLNEGKLRQGATYVKSRTASDPYEEYAAKVSVAIGQEKYGEAAEYLQVCIDNYEGETEDVAALHLKKAGLHILDENYDAALPELDTVLELEPKNADALYLRLQLALERDDLEAAARDALAYEALSAPDGETLEKFAQIHEAAGDPENAIRCYTKLLEDEALHKTEYLAERGRCLLQQEKIAEAQKDFEDYFLEGGKDEKGEVALWLCGCCLKQEQFEEALAAFESAREKDAEVTAELLSWVAAAYLASEEYEKAETLLKEIPAEGAEHPRAVYLAALCAFGLERYEEAAEGFSEALDLEQEPVCSRYYRAVCHVQLQEPEEAVQDLEAVIAAGESEYLESAQELLEALKEFVK